MKELDKLLTPEVKELNMQIQLPNPNIIVSTHIYVNKKLVIQNTLPKTKLQEFNIAEYENNLIGKINKSDGNANRWEIDKHATSVKARHYRASRVPQTLNNLFSKEWDKVFSIIHDQSAH